MVGRPHGWLVPPGDVPALAQALRALTLSPETRQQAGQTGQIRFQENFHIDAVVQGLRSVYADTLGRTRGAA